MKEARYHQQHAADWVVRLGQGTDESLHRAATPRSTSCGAIGAELFADDAIDEHAAATGLGPRWGDLQRCLGRGDGGAARRSRPRRSRGHAFLSTGKRGVHSEHMGFILAEMQHLQRSFPGGVW